MILLLHFNAQQQITFEVRPAGDEVALDAHSNFSKCSS